MTLKRIFHVLSFEHICLIEFAGEAPSGGKIDKDAVALFQFGLQSFRSKRLPVPAKAVGNDFRRVKFIANQVNAAPEHQQEHEYAHDYSLHARSCWRNERTFHPTDDTDHKKKTARPNSAL